MLLFISSFACHTLLVRQHLSQTTGVDCGSPAQSGKNRGKSCVSLTFCQNGYKEAGPSRPQIGRLHGQRATVRENRYAPGPIHREQRSPRHQVDKQRLVSVVAERSCCKPMSLRTKWYVCFLIKSLSCSSAPFVSLFPSMLDAKASAPRNWTTCETAPSLSGGRFFGGTFPRPTETSL